MSSRPPNWYLDPLVAQQKRQVHLEWIRRNVTRHSTKVLLKTDLFEEANGEDELLFSMPFAAELKLGIDIDETTVRRASLSRPGTCNRFVTADVRHLPFEDSSVDIVLSNSTLDHFDNAGDLEVSIRELARVLKQGGLLLITLDNPRNPLYLLFRAGARRYGLTFRLGHTADQRKLARLFESAGLEMLSTDLLLHNPRFLSTLLFLALRRLRLGDRVIGALLSAFSFLGKLPTRGYTAVFVAACGQKPDHGPQCASASSRYEATAPTCGSRSAVR